MIQRWNSLWARSGYRFKKFQTIWRKTFCNTYFELKMLYSFFFIIDFYIFWSFCELFIRNHVENMHSPTSENCTFLYSMRTLALLNSKFVRITMCGRFSKIYFFLELDYLKLLSSSFDKKPSNIKRIAPELKNYRSQESVQRVPSR